MQQHITDMFDGVPSEYKAILLGNNKQSFIETITKLSSAIMADSVLPKPKLILDAFRKCDFNNLTVVLIGQDPYPTPGDANGLCFSVSPGVAVPKSLKNIYSALEKSGFTTNPDGTPADRTSGDLSHWATQGVLMLNMALTIGADKTSHLEIWQPYTKKVLEDLATQYANQGKPLIFILWGGYAQGLQPIIDKVNNNILNDVNITQKTVHRVLTWGHPSPISSYNKGDPTVQHKHFTNCDNFTTCNKILKELGKPQISW